MSIRRTNNFFFLARLAGTGNLHEHDCPSYGQENYFSGLSCYPSGVVQETPEGRTLLQIPPSFATLGAMNAMSLRGLLHLLIAEAAINQWLPDEERTWARISHRLRSAAMFIDTPDGQPLSERLCVPDAYTRDAPSQNHETLKALLCHNLPGPLLIAPIKGCESGPKATRLMLKHLPGIRFWLPAAHAAQLTPPATPLFGLAILELQSGSQSANLNVRHMAVLWTDRCYTPCPDEAIARVAEQLRKTQQAFLTPLRFDANESHLLADFALLRDHGAEPAFVVGSDYPDSRAKKALATVLRRYFPVSIFDVDATALST